MIVGHKKQLDILRQMAKTGNFPHALLFCGEKGLGKRKAALEFVKILNCEFFLEKGEPCYNCFACTSIEKGNHPDVVLVEPQEKSIQIDQIRNVISKISLKPFYSNFKSIIITDAHLMNQAAQTALLKTLEEPSEGTIFILITPYPEMLLLTILSRVQKLKFYKVPKEEIEKFLVKNGQNAKDSKLVSFWSFGRPGIAISLLEGEEGIIKEKGRRENFINLISNDNLAEKFNYVKNIFPKQKTAPEKDNLSPDVGVILDDFTAYFRELLILKIGALVQDEGQSDFQKIITKYTIGQLKDILSLIQRMKFLVGSTNANSKLALEIIMLKI